MRSTRDVFNIDESISRRDLSRIAILLHQDLYHSEAKIEESVSAVRMISIVDDDESIRSSTKALL